MSFLSFLSSFLPTHFSADNSHNNQTDETDEINEISDTDGDVTIMERSDKFLFFPRLPAELRHMIIKEALYEHEEGTRRVLLLDPLAYRISPTKELASMAPSLLSVNSEFRSTVLKVLTKIDVLDLGAPSDNQYGEENNWYLMPLNREYLFYDRALVDQMEDEVEAQGQQKGCLYINPKKDTFITSIVPRQVALTTIFQCMPGEPDKPWAIPRDFVTEKLQGDTCAKIATMRELEWDVEDRCLGCGTCLLCGHVGHMCCTENFFDERGSQWVPLHSSDDFTGVKSFGFYLLTAGNDMEQFLYNFTVMGGKRCLEEVWDRKYLEFDLERLV